MTPSYSWQIEGDAYLYLVGLPKRQRKRLERAFVQLATHPFQPALFEIFDEDSGPLRVIAAEEHFITFHSDHAVRRVRITEIQPIP